MIFIYDVAFVSCFKLPEKRIPPFHTAEKKDAAGLTAYAMNKKCIVLFVNSDHDFACFDYSIDLFADFKTEVFRRGFGDN